MNRRNQFRNGFTGGIANPQFDYDHRQDSALFLDPDFVKRKLRAMQTSYDEYADLADVHGGPAVIETFGEKPFSPVSKPESWAFTEAQQKLQLELDNESGQITNRYIKGEERSFTIIAYPIPEIGEDFPEIFREIVKINTLDYKKYQKIQQTIIDTLDTCEWVEIKGKGENETDLLIHLHALTDAKTQTNFENCVADVNIPVGEVFTSPRLKGTQGILHVSRVYLNELCYRDLKITFQDGRITDYTCKNFDTEEENKKYYCILGYNFFTHIGDRHILFYVTARLRRWKQEDILLTFRHYHSLPRKSQPNRERFLTTINFKNVFLIGFKTRFSRFVVNKKPIIQLFCNGNIFCVFLVRFSKYMVFGKRKFSVLKKFCIGIIMIVVGLFVFLYFWKTQE